MDAKQAGPSYRGVTNEHVLELYCAFDYTDPSAGHITYKYRSFLEVRYSVKKRISDHVHNKMIPNNGYKTTVRK